MKVLRGLGSLLIGLFTYIILVVDRTLTAPFVGIDQPGVQSLTNPNNMHRRAKSKYYVKVAKRMIKAGLLIGVYYLYKLIF